ncbi:MAG: hypothetical protein KBC32_01825 [Candidatus Didemnitutus sp.]|nr:hypothetical protein [Candidatus Didemnitutus sp.]
MKDFPADSHIPLGKLAWVVLIAVAGAPLLFFALVTPKEKPVDEPAKIELPPSKLQAVGLRENRDWDGLPEMFAVWADQLFWTEDKTTFAYWNPGSRSYSYYFEATRYQGVVRFKSIGRAARERSVDALLIDEHSGQSDTHPFLFPAWVRIRDFPNPPLPLPASVRNVFKKDDAQTPKVILEKSPTKKQ